MPNNSDFTPEQIEKIRRTIREELDSCIKLKSLSLEEIPDKVAEAIAVGEYLHQSISYPGGKARRPFAEEIMEAYLRSAFSAGIQ